MKGPLLPRVETAVISRESLMETRATTIRHESLGRSYWHGWVRSFQWRVPGVVAISG